MNRREFFSKMLFGVAGAPIVARAVLKRETPRPLEITVHDEDAIDRHVVTKEMLAERDRMFVANIRRAAYLP